MNHRAFLFLILMSLDAFGFVSSQTTLSGGAYRDYNENDHFVSIIDWQMQITSSSGSEFYLDLGLNNNLVQDEWNLYPQQINALFPIGESSSLKLGRFILNESMFYGLFDGAIARNQYSEHLEFSVYAGALTFLEQTKEFNDEHLLMGLSSRVFNQTSSIKWSLLNRQMDDQNQFLTSVQALRKNDWTIPTDVSLELRYLSDEQEIERSHFEWHSYFGDRMDVAYYFKTDNPKLSLPQKKNLWYRLTSSSDVLTHGLIPNYQITSNGLVA